MDAYWEAYDATKRGINGVDLREMTNSNAGYTAEENAARDWLCGIVEEDWPLISIKQLFHRRFTKHQVNFSYKRIAMIVLLLAEVVEKKLRVC